VREIKYRGKSIETGEWVYGYYVYTHDRHRIIYEDYEGFYCEEEVDPETIGQCIGLKDKNGTEIYEGDIVIAWSAGVKAICEVKWGRGRAGFFLYRKPNIAWNLSGGGKDYNEENVEVIGNIYEHLHLLETEN